MAALPGEFMKRVPGSTEEDFGKAWDWAREHLLLDSPITCWVRLSARGKWALEDL